MAQIPILSGVYTDANAEFRVAYPVNLEPVPVDSGISKGFLRPAEGITQDGTGPGNDRGGINWLGTCYRVMGTKLVTVDAAGAVVTRGDVGVGKRVAMDYGFDRLMVVSGGNAYYFNGGTLSRITDPDLGTVTHGIWIDGYYMFTDGTNIIVTDLADPMSVNPLKYGSAEVDPDPIMSIVKTRNEAHAVGRYTIEVFQNIGGSLFPFQRIEGAMALKGAIGIDCACEFVEGSIAFLGSGRNEPPSVYLSNNAQVARIATREIDTLLQTFTEAQLSASIVERRIDKGHTQLWIRLPDRTIVYDLAASQALEEPVWFQLVGGVDGFASYPAANLVWCYNQWIVGDPALSHIGHLTPAVSTQWGNAARWEFSTLMIYNGSRSGIVNELELVTVTGRTALGLDPRISTSYSRDGVSWSQDKSIRAGAIGQTMQRIVWRQQGTIRNFRVQRFRGDTQAFASFARLEAQIEGLTV